MKLRVRLDSTTRLLTVGDDARLSDLEELVAAALRDIFRGSFKLSLNRVDGLPDEDGALSDCGVVSGDLVYVLPEGRRFDSREEEVVPPSVGRGSEEGLLLLLPGPPEEEESSAAGMGKARRRSQGGGGSKGKGAAKRKRGAGEKNWLCRDVEDGQVPAQLDALYDSARVAVRTEALSIALHQLMLEAGFRPELDAGSPVIHQIINSMPQNWKSRGDCYRLEYVHPEYEGVECTVTCVPMHRHSFLVIHKTIRDADASPEKQHLSLKCSDYVRHLPADSAAACYKNLRKLSRIFNDSLVLPLLKEIKIVLGIQDTSGLLGLPYELKIKILQKLSLVSVLNVSETSKKLNPASKDQYLWKLLCLRDFRHIDPNHRTDNWYELYKSQYRIRKEENVWRRRTTIILPWSMSRNNLTHNPQAPFHPGMLGGDYDLHPETYNENGSSSSNLVQREPLLPPHLLAPMQDIPNPFRLQNQDPRNMNAWWNWSHW